MAKYILGDLFSGDFPITQYYGARPEYYKQFGLAGHEGVDWATPSGTPVLAPFDGTVIRDQDDPRSGAYGTHLVLWDPKQLCAVWYCHLQRNIVKVGDKVTKGSVLGYSGNTGNSSGPHLHMNLVETDARGNRLNLTNGYQGFLNPLDSKLVKWTLGDQPAPPKPTQPTPQPFTDDELRALQLLRDYPHQGNLEGLVRELIGHHQDHARTTAVLAEVEAQLAKTLVELKKAQESVPTLATFTTTQLLGEAMRRLVGG